jgi:hypothetical protein
VVVELCYVREKEVEKSNGEVSKYMHRPVAVSGGLVQ